jgi:hypothetical protein
MAGQIDMAEAAAAAAVAAGKWDGGDILDSHQV